MQNWNVAEKNRGNEYHVRTTKFTRCRNVLWNFHGRATSFCTLILQCTQIQDKLLAVLFRTRLSLLVWSDAEVSYYLAHVTRTGTRSFTCGSENIIYLKMFVLFETSAGYAIFKVIVLFLLQVWFIGYARRGWENELFTSFLSHFYC